MGDGVGGEQPARWVRPLPLAGLGGPLSVKRPEQLREALPPWPISCSKPPTRGLKKADDGARTERSGVWPPRATIAYGHRAASSRRDAHMAITMADNTTIEVRLRRLGLELPVTPPPHEYSPPLRLCPRARTECLYLRPQPKAPRWSAGAALRQGGSRRLAGGGLPGGASGGSRCWRGSSASLVAWTVSPPGRVSSA